MCHLKSRIRNLQMVLSLLFVLYICQCFTLVFQATGVGHTLSWQTTCQRQDQWAYRKDRNGLLPLLDLLIQSATALVLHPKIWLAERQIQCDWEHEDIAVCMHSGPGNSQNFWIRSATSAVAAIEMQHKCPIVWQEVTQLCHLPVQWGIGALCAVTENTTVQLLILSIKILVN